MDDGKPLRVSIRENKDALILEFIKTGEGSWAELTGVICKAGADLELRISREQVRLGPAANWMLRLALADGGVFRLHQPAPALLHIATHGWSGHFRPQASP